MNDVLFENTKISAYFLWEYSKHDNALDLWLCAEDIAFYFETKNYLEYEGIISLLNKGIHDISYVNFIRHIAFSIYIYSRKNDAVKNWYIAEKLTQNEEWLHAVVKIAEIYNLNRSCFYSLTGVRSDKVKNYYKAI